ncbi:MAG: methylenetetrahydrofolate reductase, partial [Christensenellaceae bacterium]|nr:methylenetetrahydrofolate reductase [Christensenellaceae bacterium]
MNFPFSIEVFPPRNDGQVQEIEAALPLFAALKPSFISVTCGASGTGTGGTSDIAIKLKQVHKTESVAHIIALAS